MNYKEQSERKQSMRCFRKDLTSNSMILTATYGGIIKIIQIRRKKISTDMDNLIGSQIPQKLHIKKQILATDEFQITL